MDKGQHGSAYLLEGQRRFLGRTGVQIFGAVLTDSPEMMINQLTELQSIALQETRSLINMERYMHAVSMLAAADSIDIYGSGINLHLAHDFAYKIARIHRQVQIGLDHQHQILSAAIPQSNHCAIIISYSGETFTTVQYAKSLHEMKVPIVSITCTGENSVAKYADERLYIATLEKQFSKIGSFASCTSITAILNYLYCGIFQLNYEENYKKLLSTVLRATAFRSQATTLREDF